MILLAKEISNQDDAFLKLMDITVTRNAYGRQQASFITHHEFNQVRIPMTFIRAPFILSVEKDVEILATYEDKIIAARQKNMLVTAFHPELTQDFTVVNYFLEMIKTKL